MIVALHLKFFYDSMKSFQLFDWLKFKSSMCRVLGRSKKGGTTFTALVLRKTPCIPPKRRKAYLGLSYGRGFKDNSIGVDLPLRGRLGNQMVSC
jgi:hypothetical protein